MSIKKTWKRQLAGFVLAVVIIASLGFMVACLGEALRDPRRGPGSSEAAGWTQAIAAFLTLLAAFLVFVLQMETQDRIEQKRNDIESRGVLQSIKSELEALSDNAKQNLGKQIVELDGEVLAVGVHVSSGYREYRGTEGRAGHQLLALICVPLGMASEEDDTELPTTLTGASGDTATAPTVATQGEMIDIASFYVGNYLLGVPAVSVVEAIPFGSFVRLPNASEKVCGAMIYDGRTMLIYDLHKALGVASRTAREEMITVVLRGEDDRTFGVLVERLGDIPVVPVDDIAPVSSVFVGITPVLASVVKSRGGQYGQMLTLLAVEHMADILRQEDVAVTNERKA